MYFGMQNVLFKKFVTIQVVKKIMFADCRAPARQSREAPKPKAINLKEKFYYNFM